MKNVLNVIVDILTLMALCVAAIGHVLPWFQEQRIGNGVGLDQVVSNFQIWHSTRSGIALAVLAGLIFLSLIFNWWPVMRRLLTLAMFASAFFALLFELLVFSNASAQFGWGVGRRLTFQDTDIGFAMSVIPTGIAVFLCLLRMLWTMPATRVPRMPMPVTADRKPVVAVPVPEASFSEHRV